jgi:hypothetical protein
MSALFKKFTSKGEDAGVYLSEAPVLIPTGKGVGGRGVDEPVRRLEGRWFTRGVENTNINTDCISSP